MNDTSLAGATFLLVIVTLGLVVVTTWQIRQTRRAFEWSIRPLLAEAQPDPRVPEVETILFGAPGRESFEVQPGRLYTNHDGTKISVPFRNIGAGVAVITSATADPEVMGSVETDRRFVPVGEHVRVNISSMSPEHVSLNDKPGKRLFKPGQWWGHQQLVVSVHYTDAAGKQPLISRATFSQAATHGPWIESIAVYRRGHKKPIAIGRATQ